METCPALRAADRIHENWSIEIHGRLGRSRGYEEETYCLRETDSFRLVALLETASIKGDADNPRRSVSLSSSLHDIPGLETIDGEK